MNFARVIYSTVNLRGLDSPSIYIAFLEDVLRTYPVSINLRIDSRLCFETIGFVDCTLFSNYFIPSYI